MLPVALFAVTIPQPTAAAVQPVPVLTASSQPAFSTGVQPDNVLLAQAIVPADTSTIVSPSGSQIEITGGQVSGDGANLFHSFEQFGLSEQQTANFIASPQVHNVLGRVLGGDASYIDGILQVSNSDASLYLINPAGILFGENARLDLTGSFTAATADRIGFGGGWWDSASDHSQLMGGPTRFSFGAPGSLVNLGDLAVGENQSLTLLGGNVVNTGSASAPGGRVTLAAVNGQRVATLGVADGLLTMELSPSSTVQQVSALSLPELLTGGDFLEGSELAIAADGTVSLQGATLPTGTGTTATTGVITAAGVQGGELNLLGEHVALLGNSTLDVSGLASGGTVRIGGGYQGNDSIPNADLTYMGIESRIIANAGTAGDGGSVILWSDGLTQFYGNVEARGGEQFGNGGFVEVSGKVDLAFDGDVNLTAPNGNNGHLLLDPGFVNIDNVGTNDISAFGAVQPNQITQTQGGTAQTFSISAGRIETALNTNDVTIAAAQGIRVNAEINATGSDNGLTLEAPQIDVFAAINLDGGDINLTASDSSRQLAQEITLFGFDDALTSNGGNITLTGPRIEINSSINSGGGDITFNGPVFVDAPFLGNLPHAVSSGTGAGDIRFNSTLDSQGFNSVSDQNSLIVTAGTGNVFFEDAIGSINSFGDLFVVGLNQFDLIIPSGNNVSLTDFSGDRLVVDVRGDITINAAESLSSRLGLRTQDGGNIRVVTQEDLNLTDSNIGGFSSDGVDVQITALNGTVTLDDSSIASGFGNTLLESQSITVENNSSLSSRETLRLRTEGVDNFVAINDSTIEAEQVFISSPDGIVTFNNSSSTPGFANDTGEIDINARLINIEADSLLEADISFFSAFDGSLRLNAAESIDIDSSSLRAGQNIELVAANTVQITDSAAAPSIIRSRSDLLVEGGQSIDIQSLQQPQSVFRADGAISLVSDGTIVGQGRFLNGGDFSVLTLSDTPGTFSYTPISSDGIISSGGSVSFGDYTGSSLKVEAGGDITVSGDISITAPNTTLQGTDSDIVILSNDPALILRAGLTPYNPQSALPELSELRNEANLPPDRTVEGTTFSASGATPATGNIIVGNIRTENGPVILSATGDVSTGSIDTNGDGFSDDTFGGFVDLSAGGSITVATIDTSGSDGGNVLIAAGGTFRATDTFLENDFTDGGTTLENIEGAPVLGVPVLKSIDASGGSTGGANIDISHGGREFIVGPVFQVDENGNVIYREFSEVDGDIVLGEQVFPVEDIDGNVIIGAFENADGNPADNPVLALSEPFSSTDPNVSFTAGAITSNQENEGLVVSVRDNPIVGAGTVVVGDGRIELTSTFTDTGGGTTTGGGGTGGGTTGGGTTGGGATTPAVTTTAAEVQEATTAEQCSVSDSVVAEVDPDAITVATRNVDPTCGQPETDDVLQIEMDEPDDLTSLGASDDGSS